MNLAATMSLDTARFVQPLNAARSALGGFTGAIAAAGNIGSIFSGIQSAFSLARGAIAPLGEAIKAAANNEDLATTFRTLLGDAQLAAQAMKEATDFADATPFDPEPVQQGHKTLLAYGFALKDIKSLMTDAGDLASVMKVELGDVVRLFGRLKSGDFGEAFERLRDFGISRSDLEAKGLVFDKGGSFVGTAAQAMAAVSAIVREKFGGTMDAVSKTWNGRWSTFVGYVHNLFKEFGKPITESLKPALDQAVSVAQQLAPIAKQISEGLAPLMSGALEKAMGVVRGIVAAIKSDLSPFKGGDPFSAFKSGGGLIENLNLAIKGAARLFLTSFSTAIGGVIQLLKVGVQGVFQSAVALLSQPSIWQGVASSVMSIVYNVRAALYGLFADLISKLPTTMRFGANVEGLRGSAEADAARSQRFNRAAADAFGRVDFSMSPMADAARKAGSVIAETWSTILGQAGSIPEFQQLRDNFAILSDSTRQLVKATTEQAAAQLSIAAGVTASPSNSRPGGSAYDLGDTLAKVGGFIGSRDSAMTNEQKRTNSLMQMSVDLLKSGIEIWKGLQLNATWA